MKYLSPFDPHVHLRGTEYEYDYFGAGFKDAEAVGLCGMLEMPNTTPFLTTPEAVAARRAKLHPGGIYHGVHIGLTNDLAQAVTALKLAMAYDTGVCSDKIFYVNSTGNMGLQDPEYQRFLWQVKAGMGYKGVSVGHFEDEFFWFKSFDPTNAKTHSLKQTELSETVQVIAQLRNAVDAGFEGTFYVAHVSSPDTLRYLDRERRLGRPFEIVAEVTWHHLFLNTEAYFQQGNLVKMNPPLRSPESQKELLELTLEGFADVIGTDHAPHSIEKKSHKERPASGVPALPFWPKGIELLREHKVSKKEVEDLTCLNALQIFKLADRVKPWYVEVEYQPELWVKYGYNPFYKYSEVPLNR